MIKGKDLHTHTPFLSKPLIRLSLFSLQLFSLIFFLSSLFLFWNFLRTHVVPSSPSVFPHNSSQVTLAKFFYILHVVKFRCHFSVHRFCPFKQQSILFIISYFWKFFFRFQDPTFSLIPSYLSCRTLSFTVLFYSTI